jgi:hypothetical protein
MLRLATVLKKVGFANLLSIISLLASVTCFVLLSRIAYHNTMRSLSDDEPKYIETENIKVTTEDTEARATPSSQENIVNDIDSLIDSIPSDKKYNNEDMEIIQKIVDQANIKNQHNTADNNKPKTDSNSESIYAKSDSKYKIIASKITPKQSHKLQLAAFKTHSEAVAAWFRLKQKYVALLNQYNYTVFKSDNDTLYRLQIICQNAEESENLCNSLKANGVACIIVP